MPSVVLSRRDIREFDQLVSLYSLEQGRIEVLARGLKKFLSKNSSYLLPGNIVEAEIIVGKENYNLGTVEPVESWSNLRKNFAGQLFLQWSLDFFSKFTPAHEPDRQKFILLYKWIKFLNQKNKVELIDADNFARRVLVESGFDPGEKISHNALHKFAVYYLEKNLPDWGQLVVFN